MSRFGAAGGEAFPPAGGLMPSPANSDYAGAYSAGLDGASEEHHHASAVATLSAVFATGLNNIMSKAVRREDINNLHEGADGGCDAADGSKARRGPAGSSSRFRGVTRHRRTKRWEAHIWDSKKQVYLGGFDEEGHAAKAHDVMALKTRGVRTLLNFKPSVYAELLPLYDRMSRDEVVRLLRGQSKKVMRNTPQPSPRPRATTTITHVKPSQRTSNHGASHPSPQSRHPANHATGGVEPRTPPRQQQQQQQQQQIQGSFEAAAPSAGPGAASAGYGSPGAVIGSPGAHLHALLMRKHHRLELQHMLLYSGLQLPTAPHSPLLPTPNPGKTGDSQCLIPNLHPGAPSSVNPMAAFDMLLPPSAPTTHPTRRNYGSIGSYHHDSPLPVPPCTASRATEPRARVVENGVIESGQRAPGRDEPLPSSVLVAGRGGVRGGPASQLTAAVPAAAGMAGAAGVLARAAGVGGAKGEEEEEEEDSEAAAMAGAAGVMALRRGAVAGTGLLHETPELGGSHKVSHGPPHGRADGHMGRVGMVPVAGPGMRVQQQQGQQPLSHVQQLRQAQQGHLLRQAPPQQQLPQQQHMPFGLSPYPSPLSSPSKFRSHSNTNALHGLGSGARGHNLPLFETGTHGSYAGQEDGSDAGSDDAGMEADDDGFGAHDVPLYLQPGGFGGPQQQLQVPAPQRVRQSTQQNGHQQQEQQEQQGRLQQQLAQQQARLRQRVAALMPNSDEVALFGGSAGGANHTPSSHRGRALLRAAVLAAAAEEAAEAAEEAAAAAAAACAGQGRRSNSKQQRQEEEEEEQEWQGGGGMGRGAGLMITDDGAFDDDDEDGTETELLPLQQHHIMGFDEQAGSGGGGGCC